ncbi:GNAT family N-acetyltransferase [Pseudoxanthomonas mexicana]|uniref:GNAT family N-acetyltransferase n=1 Tax=Pseudoxanthomonas mexicana TaxID=128785 RepID=UPI00398A7BF5
MIKTTASYTVEHSVPSVQTYLYLREACGLSPKTPVAAERGLSNTLFGVQVFFQGEPVGMGRIMGDGGCFYQVVDIAVLPAHQGHGLGKKIMAAIAGYIEHEVPESGYVSLLADGQAYQLYQQFGFVLTAPASVGMALRKSTAGGM